MKRSLIYFSIIKIFFFFAQFFRSIYYSHLALFSFFFRFDYFLLFRLLKFERVPPLFSSLSMIQKKFLVTAVETLQILASTFISTFVFDNEHDSASTFRVTRNVSLFPRKRQFPTDCHRSSNRLPSTLPKIFSSPMKKFDTRREVNSPVKETWEPRPSPFWPGCFPRGARKQRYEEDGSGGDTSAR